MRYLECMFLILKCECPKAENAIDILRSQSVRAQERYIQCIFWVLSPKALIVMNDPRSKTVNARKCKTQWIFFVLKAGEPKSVIFSVPSEI